MSKDSIVLKTYLAFMGMFFFSLIITTWTNPNRDPTLLALTYTLIAMFAVIRADIVYGYSKDKGEQDETKQG